MVVSRVTTVVWPKNPAKDTRSADDWTKYCSCPFNGVTGHTEYATELAKISVSYGEYMGSKNSKGVTALKLPIISYFFLLFCIYQLTITVQNLNMKSLPPLRNRSLLHESKYEIFSYLLSRNIPPQNFDICSSVIAFELQLEKNPKNQEYTISLLNYNLSMKSETARLIASFQMSYFL